MRVSGVLGFLLVWVAPATAQPVWESIAECESEPIGPVLSLHWGLGSMWVGTRGHGTHGRLAEFSQEDCRWHEPLDVLSIADDGNVLWAAEQAGHAMWRLRDCQWGRWEGGGGGTVGVPADVTRESHATGSVCYSPFGHEWEYKPEVFEGIPFLLTRSMRLTVDRVGALWVVYPHILGFGYPVVRFDGDQLECWDEPDVPDGSLGALVDEHGRVWVWGDGGASIFDGSEWTTVPGAPRLDAAGWSNGVFFGSGSDGTYLLSDSGWELITPERFRPFAARHEGGVWAVKAGRSVRIITPDEMIDIAYPNDQYQGGIISLAVDDNGTLWVGDSGGVFRLGHTTAVAGATWGQVKMK